MIDVIFNDNINVTKNNKYEINIDFDFPGWLSKSHLHFDDFRKRSTYQIKYDVKKINHIRDEMRLEQGHTDKERAANRLWMSLSSGSEILQKSFSKIDLKAQSSA